MRRVVFQAYGRPGDVLTQARPAEPTRPPGDGEVVVNILARPVHSGDILMITGTHDAVRRPLPPAGLTPGSEASGVIEAVGSGIDPARGLVRGARVFFCAIGTWCDQIVLPADAVMLVPPEVDDDLAAQLIINPITALLLTRAVLQVAGDARGALRLSAVEEVVTDDSTAMHDSGIVLLSAAGSTVGKAIAAMLRQSGFTPIGLVRSRAAADSFRAATGADVVLTQQSDWEAQVRTVADGRRIFAALDAVGGAIGNSMFDLLSPGGTLISYGDLSNEPLVIQQPHLWMEDKKVRGFGMIHWMLLPYETRAADVAAATEFVQENRHLFPVTGKFFLSQYIEAVDHFMRPARSGAVLLI